MGKDTENRSRRMCYRGPLLIHAGLAEPEWGDFLVVRDTANRMGTPVTWTDERRSLGAILGTVEVTGCHHALDCGGRDRLPGRSLRWHGCSPWAQAGQFHITLADPHPLAEPVPARGMLGLWTVPEDIESAVRAQLEASHAT
jgi:hypothetical protein